MNYTYLPQSKTMFTVVMNARYDKKGISFGCKEFGVYFVFVCLSETLECLHK